MEIFVLTPEHGKRLLEVDPELKIHELKRILEEITSIPTACQILYHNNTNLNRVRNPLRIIADPGAEFVLQNNGIFSITVASSPHGKFGLKVNQTIKFTELQKQLETLTSIPIPDQLIYHRQVEITSYEKTLGELGVLPNERLVLWHKEEILRIWVVMSYTDSIFLYAPPFISILKVQESLELRTGVPVKSQLFIHAKTDLSLSASTLRKSNIEKQDTRLAFYDMRNFIEISVRTPFQLGTEPLIFKVRPDMRIRDFQKQLETATEILIAEQLISHNDINQSLSWQTFWQLEIFTGAEFLLGNKDDIIEIKIHKNGDVEDHLSMQHQTIRILILAYLSPRPDNSIPFLCRPTADGSPARYENALDENKMLMDLGIKSGDMLCAGTISKDEI